MILINNWKSLYKAFSVQAMVLSGVVLSAWEVLPADLKSSIPQDWLHYIAIGLLLLGIVGRAIDQPNIPK